MNSTALSRAATQDATALADRAIDRAAGGRPIPGNWVSLLIDGPITFKSMFALIEQAQHRIHFENYIIRNDRIGRQFAEALSAKARAGVEVRVLYDWLGCIGTAAGYWRNLAASGVEVRRFNSMRVVNVFANLTRDHRKLVTADGHHAVLGGLCIGDEWVGDAARGIQPWRDTAVEIRGPAAISLDQAFEQVWRRSGGQPFVEAPRGEVEAAGQAAIRVLAGIPGHERTYRVLELLAAGCAERLWVTDAYMVPPPRLFQGLLDAALDGADVRLLVPGQSDLPWIRNLTRIGYRDLLRAGVRIYEWEGPMLHAKTIVADGRWVRIGSSNLNASSLLGNYELDVLVDDPGLAAEFEAQYRRDLVRSAEVQRHPLRAPARLRAVLPSGLHREKPEMLTPAHRPSIRERRRRAVVALWTLATGARRSIFGPISLVLIILGALFLVLPRAMAYAFAAACTWFAVAAGIEAFRRRRET